MRTKVETDSEEAEKRVLEYYKGSQAGLTKLRRPKPGSNLAERDRLGLQTKLKSESKRDFRLTWSSMEGSDAGKNLQDSRSGRRL